VKEREREREREKERERKRYEEARESKQASYRELLYIKTIL